MKILNATDEHVMALGANFSLQADSHLVCMQNEQGYKTQAINIQNQARKGALPLTQLLKVKVLWLTSGFHSKKATCRSIVTSIVAQ